VSSARLLLAKLSVAAAGLPNARGRTPLHTAAALGREKLVALLVADGHADVAAADEVRHIHGHALLRMLQHGCAASACAHLSSCCVNELADCDNTKCRLRLIGLA
jgi:ankyrin repeat protein